jgi:hypothetical protein
MLYAAKACWKGRESRRAPESPVGDQRSSEHEQTAREGLDPREHAHAARMRVRYNGFVRLSGRAE